MFTRIATNLEGLAKGLAFDCRRCGQCVLTSTRLVCPMRCPKNLRNGPCGGTVEGRCEVYPERACIWCKIDERRHGDRIALPPLLDSPDPKLFNTPSYVNFINGKDKRARVPLPYLPLEADAGSITCHTESRLEARLRSGAFALTTEVRAPRGASTDRVLGHARNLVARFDAVNATAFLAGKPSLPSPRVAAALQAAGVEAVAQATCRDHTQTTFVAELMDLHASGVHNLLCLTGDAYRDDPGSKPSFAMDAALMLYEARYLRERGSVRFTGDAVKQPPRQFLGAAINPFTTPQRVPLRRLLQKAAAGADFIQTQCVFDLPAFQEFVRSYIKQDLHRSLFLLPGIPVVISPRALAALDSVPGMVLPRALRARLDVSTDLRRDGVTIARELLHSVAALPGVRGAHLMLFGADHDALLEVADGCPDHATTISGEPIPCPSTACAS
ncbi:MAG: methylenetetrahydrofolate reductase C-terminal domain-containing protein [Planctomycetota bacterium]|jgi:methylenetetrahydrofolate reductase (NADPH)|nr:methylenetetrahydrofolate reductase C-terminal domain-containing protein [Planctomycetota bacterium]